MKTSVREDAPVIVQEKDCELEEWNDEIRGKVQWRTLISGDRTATSSLTCGVAELPVGASRSVRVHQHAPAEIYYILEGQGLLSINGAEHDVCAGSTAYIPSNVVHGLINTGPFPLRLFYVFPVDSFTDVDYIFPADPG